VLTNWHKSCNQRFYPNTVRDERKYPIFPYLEMVVYPGMRWADMIKKIQSGVAVLFMLLALISGNPETQVTADQKSPGNHYYFPILESTAGIESSGPDGGGVTGVLFNPQNPAIAYIGSWGAGVFKSQDGGINWTPASTGLDNLQIQSLVIDPQNPDTLYAGTYRYGVYKTTNGGASWFASGQGLNYEAIVYALAVDPNNPQVIFAGTRSPGSTPPWGGGVFKSNDGGQTWINHTYNLGEEWVYGLAIDPRNTQVIYAATHSAGIYKSTDGGHNWTAVNNGITDLGTRTVAIDPSNSNVVYAGSWHGPAVFKTTNGGQSWSAVNNGMVGAKIISVVIDPAHPSTVYALSYLRGLFKSDNGGGSWSAAGLYPDYVFSLAINPADHQVLLASAENDALFRSISGAMSWVNSSHGVHATSIPALAADPALPGVVFAGLNGQGVYRSGDDGQTWTAMNNGLGDLNVRALAVTPAGLFAGTASGGIYKIVSPAQDWQVMNSGLGFSEAKTWIDNPALSRFSPLGPAADYQLDDINPGESSYPDPKAVLPAPVQALAPAPSANSTIYAGTAGSGVYRSTNNGDTWQAAGLSGKTVLSLAVDQVNAARLWAGTDAPRTRRTAPSCMPAQTRGCTNPAMAGNLGRGSASRVRWFMP
jgi:photosystem II stability/assembly factor-like uncharacterized protein